MDPTTGAFVLEHKDGSPAEKRSRTEEELPPSKMQKPNSDASPDVSQVKALFERKRILEQKLKEVNESLAKIDKAIEDRTAVKAAEAQALEAKLEAEAKPTEIPVPVAPPKAKTPKRKPKKATKKGTTKKSVSSASPARTKRQRKKSSAPQELGSSVPLSPGLESCKSVLTAVMNHRFGFPFLQPVDPVALNIPDYFDVIKHPMDFGTIRKKLYAGEYEDVADFTADAYLVFSNACTYNHPGTDVFIMTETLRDFFSKKMKPIEDRERRSKNKGERNLHDIKKTVGTIQADLKQLSAVDKSQVPMTKNDMRKLSATINSLSYKHLNTIIQIIQESMPSLGGEGELEIDLNSLDTVTLRKLEAFVATVKRKKSKKKSNLSHSQRELAKKSQEGTAREIETVQRQIEQLRDPNHPARPASQTTAKPATPPVTPVAPPSAPPKPTPLASSTIIEEETVRVEDSSSDSESSSDSGSSGSDSESASDTESEADDKPNN